MPRGEPRRALALSALLLGLAACADPPPAAGPSALHRVGRVERPYLSLRLAGLVANRAPEGYAGRGRDIPTVAVAEEGLAVEPGDPLWQVDAQYLGARRERRERELVIHRQRQRRRQLGLEQQLVERRAWRAATRERLQVIEAGIERTRSRDAEALAIAERTTAHRAAAPALERERFARLDALTGRPGDDPSARRRARDNLERERGRLRVAEAELALLRSNSRALERARLELDRELVRSELGLDEPASDYDEIATIAQRLELEAVDEGNRMRRLERESEQDATLLDTPAVRARSHGRVRHAGQRIGPNARFDTATVLFVLRDRDMGFVVDVPERWRDLLHPASPAEPERGRVLVDIPPLGLRDLPGHIDAVAAVPLDGPHGSTYRTTIALDAPQPGLSEGMRVDCRLLVPVAARAPVVPVWCLVDRLDPAVVLADGRRQAISGRLIGSRFVVADGLEPGTAIRRRSASAGPAPQRLHSTVEPVASRDLEIPWRREILDMVRDGSAVERGQVVAVIGDGRRGGAVDPLEEAAFEREKADAAYGIARIEATARLVAARLAWRKAVIAAQRRRLDLLAARAAVDPAAVIRAVEATAAAQRARQRAEAERRDARLQHRAGTLSTHDLRAAELAVERAQRTHAAARLAEVAARRAVDRLELWSLTAELRAARDQADAARRDLAAARLHHQQELHAAELAHRRSYDRAHRWERAAEQTAVRAPFAGRVYYRNVRGEPLQLGERLRTTRPFFMPVDHRRQVRFAVPAHRYGDYALGDPIPLRVPLLGTRPVAGRVSAVARHFHRPRETTAGDGAPVGRVFTLTIELDPELCRTRRIPPGIGAWMELER